MAETNPSTPPASGASSAPKPRPRNPVFKMMGLPALPRKLPSRNWLIFWALSSSFAAAIIYDKREKIRATAKWRRAVAPLSKELLPNASQLPRKLTVYLEAPPGDGLRTAQDHFIEYVKPILAASGLDWEFVQGRQQGDVRAAVAERIRRSRKAHERPDEELPQTDEAIVEQQRKKIGLPDYEGTKGDIVIGRHTWKEYVRGLHEGWLGPLDPPPLPVAETLEDKPEPESPSTEGEGDKKSEDKKPEEEKKDETPKRPPQPRPHNSPDDYSSAALPANIPAEFSPSAPIAFPHRLGFRHTFVRLGRFLTRRHLADDIGREVAAVCFAAARDWREADGQYEQQLVLKHEENDWPKFVWKDEPEAAVDDAEKEKKSAEPPKEKIWASNLVVDSRIVERMRRFEIQPEDEARAQKIVVPETEIEGWMKRNLRSLYRWGASSFASKPTGPNVGNLDDD
ncbi:mitochondrial import inner membrane translocase subunit tim54 [Trichoderma arundinaceum]|uniref:Mitochondrial import inner membrane translocase subunit TIM54 n=1 Tax=Trichoderma arundinaceum TaxID=490622 RepID=A0A395NIQ8_TRIAR|nr:mitochondrial import inner membrane translocase subunit tim54 [Trichoderma arundinaceum]